MDPLSQLTYDMFRERLGQTFRDAEAAIDLELVGVEDLTEIARNVPPGQRAPFSLIFRGPLEPMLGQGMRPLAHEELGELPIFIVPIEAAGDGVRYQAVFS